MRSGLSSKSSPMVRCCSCTICSGSFCNRRSGCSDSCFIFMACSFFRAEQRNFLWWRNIPELVLNLDWQCWQTNCLTPLWTEIMCFLRQLEVLKATAHCGQGWGRTPVWSIKCRTKACFHLKLRPHLLQTYGFIPLCNRVWSLMFCFVENPFPQVSQIHGFSFVWRLLCAVRAAFEMNPALHTSQVHGLSLIVWVCFLCEVRPDFDGKSFSQISQT